MYSLSNNMRRPYTINIRTGVDKQNDKPIVKKFRILPGVAGEMEIDDEEAATIKKMGGPVGFMLKSKELELVELKSDEDIAAEAAEAADKAVKKAAEAKAKAEAKAEAKAGKKSSKGDDIAS